MKVLLTGSNGQLGRACKVALVTAGHSVVSVDKPDFDLLDTQAAYNTVISFSPEAVIHCAAYTNVDKAETEIDLCYKTNTAGTKALADACNILDIPLVFISSDYVYDGMQLGCIGETTPLNPLNVYGRSKQLAEEYIKTTLDKYFIIRTGWLYGEGTNFFTGVYRCIKAGQQVLEIVSDQVGSPTSAVDLSNFILELLSTTAYGIYNAVNTGYVSKAEAAEFMLEVLGSSAKVKHVSTKEYNIKHNLMTQRPLRSRLCTEKMTLLGFAGFPL